jgi:hypothetical protein
MAPGAGFDISALGFSSNFVRSVQVGREGNGFPNFSITDAGAFGRPDSTGNPSLSGTASAALSKVAGRHTVKFGWEQRLYRRSDWGTSFSTGSFAFGRSFTQGPNPLQASATAGYGVATFLLGTPTSGSAGFTTDTTVSMNHTALFVQDDWKVNSKLTLNLGLRWEYEGPVTDRYNVFPNLDPGIDSPLKVPGLTLKGGYVYPGIEGREKGLTMADYSNYGPRFGFAYQFCPKTVIRGGYGIVFIPTFGPGGTSTGAGFAVTTAMQASNDGGLTPYHTLADPFPALNPIQAPTGTSLGAMTAVGGAAGGQLRDVHRGYSQQWNFTVQHEPWQNWLFEGAWVANHGTGLIMNGRPLNITSDADLANYGSRLVDTVPNPFYGIIKTGALSTTTVTRRQLLYPFPHYTSLGGGNSYLGNAIYHAFAAKVEKRFSQGFSILMAYTFSKTIDDLQATGRPGAVSGTGIQNWNNLRGERSRSYQDMPQRFVLTTLWEIPYKSDLPLLNHLLGGWQINGLTTLESGRPIALTATITGGGNRPNVVPGAKARLDSPKLERWFNTDAFVLPPSFTYGNVSRTLPDVNSDGMVNFDVSLFKNFTIRERYRLQFRAEAFNLTNTPTFETPGRAVGSATFGVVTATAFTPRPREVQFALVLKF